MRKPRRLIYTKDIALKEKHQPAYNSGLFIQYNELSEEVCTDKPEVKKAYDKVEGIKVTWIGKQKSVKKKAVKKHVGLRDDSRSG